MGKKKEYYDNNWQEYKDAPDDFFMPHSFEEVMTWKVAGWALPSSVVCIIRTTDLETKKTKEFVYRRAAAAEAKCRQLMQTPNIEFCVADHDAIHHLYPESIDEFFNDEPED